MRNLQVNIAANHAEAEAWDEKQYSEMTAQQRFEATFALAVRFYGEPVDVRKTRIVKISKLEDQ